jgi:hypothetical protein
LKLLDGRIVAIKDVNLGDVLESGSVVETTMKIDNRKEKLPFYLIKGGGVDCEDIYVTGSHLVYNKGKRQFIRVENYENAEICDVESDWFSCLITSDHKIQIGKEEFWDWEDHFVKHFFS